MKLTNRNPRRMPWSSEDHVPRLQNIVNIVRDVTRRSGFDKDTCVQTVRVLQMVLEKFGCAVQPLTVTCYAANKQAVDAINAGASLAEMDKVDGAWAIRLGDPAVNPSEGPCVHLVGWGLANRILLDPTIDQIDRSEKGIVLSPLVIEIPENRVNGFMKGESIETIEWQNGQLLTYQARPSSMEYRQFPGWRDLGCNRRATKSCVKTIRKMLNGEAFRKQSELPCTTAETILNRR